MIPSLVLDIEAVSDWDALPSFGQQALLDSWERAQERLPVEARYRPKDHPREVAALSPWTARVVCVALWDSAREYGVVYHDGLGQERAAKLPQWSIVPCGNEETVLRNTHTALAQARDKRIVTYNGRNYDGPVLMTRALRHGLQVERNLVPYRYGTNDHLDLCDVLGFWGAQRSVSLDVIAASLGLQSSKQSMSGSGVEEAYRKGRIEEIARYCAADVVVTAQIAELWDRSLGASFGRSK